MLNTFSVEPPCQPTSISRRQVAGVACITVAPEPANRRASATPSAATSRLAITTRPPTISGSKISATAISNESVVTASIVSVALSDGRDAIELSRLTTDRCDTSTPFGWAVEPDV